MNRYSKNKISENSLYRLGLKLILNNTRSRRKNDDGKERETLFHVNKKSKHIVKDIDKRFPSFSDFKFKRLGVMPVSNT